MAKAEIVLGEIGGEKLFKASGTLDSTPTTANTEFTIDTGLSEINEFYMFGINENYGTSDDKVMQMFTAYNHSRYWTACIYWNTSRGGVYGQSEVVSSSAACNIQIPIKSITGGIVTLVTGSDIRYAQAKNIRWMAN